ncbi:MAG: Nif3-like dinuclear metal center hexameric protein, partial [Candidatus Nanopelagicales bacterium]
MGKPRVSDIAKILDGLYPPDLAQEWDVNGLNLGSTNKPVSKILLTVDVTKAVVEEAINENVDLIISHHPLILHPVSLLPEESQKGEIVSKLIKNDIALFNAHTNADAAARGVNDALANLLNLSDLKPINETGIGRFGKLARPMKLKDFAELVKMK